ncbi:tyrosine-type recombinase/integrase, partial [Phaeobacter sp. B1627]|uniref:tyrosine-type recombinase/integrase n=1 Tax=Phaeobacter sp. B1627 TaxID=2583809 RepID=UPI00116D0BB8
HFKGGGSTDDEKNPERRRIRQNSHLFGDFRAALGKAEIEDFRFHDLRHTFATRMLRATGNLKLVSRLLGHTSIETTMRYAHVLDTDLADAMNDFSMFQVAESRNFSRSNQCNSILSVSYVAQLTASQAERASSILATRSRLISQSSCLFLHRMSACTEPGEIALWRRS